MKNADHACRASFANNCTRVVLGLTRMYNDRLFQLCRQLDLCREGGALRFAGRVVVVIVEPAFADRNRRIFKQLTQSWDIVLSDKSGGVVRMDASGRENEFRVLGSEPLGDLRRAQRFTDTHDSDRARIAGAGNYVVAVAVERRVREVGVAVDEDGRTPVLRGHLRSIQRRTGAAT